MIHRPDTARGARHYYGWVIVVVISFTAFASAVIINPTLSVFVKPVTEEFGWSRSVFSGATAIGTLLGGVLALAVGPIIDRFGGRWVLFTGFLLLGGLLLLLGFINSLLQFYLILITARLLLQGVVNLTNGVVVAKWFVRQRGRAMAITNLSQRLGSATLPLFAQLFASRSPSGWRTAASALGILTWGVTLLPVLLWLRRQPADMGLEPDGRAVAAPEEAQRAASSQPRPADSSFTLREALRTPTFYLLLAGFCVFTFVNTGILFNLLPLLSDRGLASTQAIAILSVWSFFGIPTTLGVGLLGERLPLRHLIVVSYLGLTIGVLVLTQVQGPLLGFAFAVIHGSFFASGLFLQNLAMADYYGPAHLGAIRGFTTPILMVSNSLGPLAATLVFDIADSYSLILKLDAGMMAIITVGTLLATPPRARQPGIPLSDTHNR